MLFSPAVMVPRATSVTLGSLLMISNVISAGEEEERRGEGKGRSGGKEDMRREGEEESQELQISNPFTDNTS